MVRHRRPRRHIDGGDTFCLMDSRVLDPAIEVPFSSDKGYIDRSYPFFNAPRPDLRAKSRMRPSRCHFRDANGASNPVREGEGRVSEARTSRYS